MARGIVFSTDRLRTLFEPRSIALVGASDKSTWSLMIYVGLTQVALMGRFILSTRAIQSCMVNPLSLASPILVSRSICATSW